MREIKFRYSVNKKPKYYKNICIKKIFTLFEIECGNVYQWMKVNNIVPSHVKKDQYTGLKDNTKWEDLTEAEKKEWVNNGKKEEEWEGKEIYAWDIMQNECIESPPFLIVYQDGAFRVYDLYMGFAEYLDEVNGTSKVIGNRWENQELLPGGFKED